MSNQPTSTAVATYRQQGEKERLATLQQFWKDRRLSNTEIDDICSREYEKEYLRAYGYLAGLEAGYHLEIHPPSKYPVNGNWNCIPKLKDKKAIELRSVKNGDKAPNGIMDLPPELTVMIWDYVFEDLGCVGPVPTDEWTRSFHGKEERWKIPTLFLVNKRAYTESRPIFFKHATLRLRVDEEWVAAALYKLNAPCEGERSPANIQSPEHVIGPLLSRFRRIHITAAQTVRSFLAIDRLIWLLKWNSYRPGCFPSISMDFNEPYRRLDETEQRPHETERMRSLGTILRFHMQSGSIPTTIFWNGRKRTLAHDGRVTFTTHDHFRLIYAEPGFDGENRTWCLTLEHGQAFPPGFIRCSRHLRLGTFFHRGACSRRVCYG